MDRKVRKIAIFASGAGTNAAQIINYFQASKAILVDCLVTNKSKAGIHKVAEVNDLPIFHFENDEIASTPKLLELLTERSIDYIILSGFLIKIPPSICTSFAKKIINIHPSLLPKYGGKGMYGKNVHEAVKRNRDKESGITIHLVNENYDEGNIIFQQTCEIHEGDSLEDIQQKVQKLEHFYFPRIIEKTISSEN